ncbi:hypothetical protein FC56_GL000949 [Lentilactobacillus senioris DSM 24302 = JCM 17472]|uniref:Glycosyltransferase RgtA/B/C/D-like domain-containing protein n=1 Tax=Lentilactobacillus senioris DSM 24302 = JCM 17472 TaxID=1423802 RepID=A0A0R2D150_9LACO|nr:hypothetical protein [Lentilactobacillus senioris]KRM93283.1 hypothetical protein FC56_GL000949 [Lentilactobacillus senioris DSM 24302 = JCM 17472]
MKKLFPWLSFLVLTALFMVALFYNKTVIGYHSGTLPFELNRIGGIGAILSGPVNYVVDGTIGNPINLFYPWLIYSITYPIGYALTSFIYGYMAIFAIFTYLTLAIAYLVAKKITGNSVQAMLFSVFWTFAAYRTFDVTRSVAGEALAFAFIPLAFFGLYKLIKTQGKSWWIVTLALTLITYTYPTIAWVVSIYLIIGLIILKNKVTDMQSMWLGLTKAALISFFTTSFYWVPLLEEAKIPFQPASHLQIQTAALNPIKVLTNSVTNNVTGYGIGIVMVILLVWSFIDWHKLTFIYRSKLVWGGVSLILATNIIPWPLLGSRFNFVLMLPGMFMIMATLFISWVGSYVVASYQKSWLNWLVAGLALLAFLVPVVRMQLTAPTSDRVHYNNEASLVGFYNIDDYLPTAAAQNIKSITKNVFIVNGKREVITRDSFGNRVKFVTPKGIINTPIIYSAGTRVTIGGKPVHAYVSNRGTVAFKANMKGNVTVTSTYTVWAKAAAIISILSFIALFSGMLYDIENNR